MARVLLATSIEWPDTFDDDHPLRDALLERGLDARPAIWDDPTVEWDAADLIVLRSIWDYTRKRDAFVAWAHAAERVTPMHNPARIVEWNSHKRYLRDLDAAGIPVIPTEWLDAGTSADAVELARAHDWTDVVVKPCVSAGARDTIRGSPASVQSHIDELLPTRDLMMQPYVAATEGIGEHSLIYFGGKLSHAARKDPALTGALYSSASVVPVDPDPEERALAERVIDHIGGLLYARVDCVVTDEGARVMEIELIEPQLFLRSAPGSAERLAGLIAAELG